MSIGMIIGWHYHGGEPTWSSTIGRYIGEPTKPSWRCRIPCNRGDAERIRSWFIENLDEDVYEVDHRFNSGDPSLFIRIFDRDAALLFQMTWGGGKG